MVSSNPLISSLYFPESNFSTGLLTIPELPGLQKLHAGKVREIFGKPNAKELVMITTDRLSAYDHIVCTIPRKGAVLNLLTQWWGEHLSGIIPNHVIAIPHPNALIAKKLDMFPVEFVVRGYLSESSSATSLWHSYSKGQKNLYGVDLPEGLTANEKLPFPIITPTTKAGEGEHDTPLTYKEAKQLVDAQFGDRTYDYVTKKALEIYQRVQIILGERDILLADTKFEFGINENGEITLADEILTPDNSRLWWATTYNQAMNNGESPKDFSKEPFRKWLAAHGFKGNSQVPPIPKNVIDDVEQAYSTLYSLVTGKQIPKQPKTPEMLLKQIKFSISHHRFPTLSPQAKEPT